MIVVFVTFIAIVIYLLRQFRQLAYYDQLTKLVKRESFAEKFADLAKKNDKEDKKITILFLDIDKFKEINDNFGHNIGDMVLKKIALRLKNNLPQEYVISRLGGDEFTIAITDIASKKEVKKEVSKVVSSFKEPLIIEGSQFFISVSIGVSIYPDHDSSLEGLIKKADYAMYKAKKQQKNYVIYQK
nr:GGDEF domain-containing protein [Halanaerobacter jeridensis]